MMAALLSSWWSGKSPEGEKEEGENKTEGWSTGLGGERPRIVVPGRPRLKAMKGNFLTNLLTMLTYVHMTQQRGDTPIDTVVRAATGLIGES